MAMFNDPTKPMRPAPIVTDDDAEFQAWKAAKVGGDSTSTAPSGDEDPAFAAWKRAKGAQSPANHGASGTWGDDSKGARMFRDVSMAFGNGMIPGWMDELQAKGEPGDFQQNVLVERAGMKRFQKEHPVLNFAAQGAGMIANPLGRTLGLVGGGALFGGVAGLGEGDGSLSQRATGGAIGAAAGAATGGALKHVVGPAARMAYDAVKSGVQQVADVPATQAAVQWLSEHPIGLSTRDVTGGAMPPNATRGLGGLGARVASVAEDLSPRSPNDRANGLILEKLKADKLRLDEARQRLGMTQKPVALGDLAGDNVLGLQRGARSVPSDAKDAIPKALFARAEEQPTRVRNDLARAAGTDGGDVVARAEELIAQQRQNAQPLYERAYAAPPVDDPDVLATLKLPQFQSAFKRAQRIAKLEGVELPPLTKTETIGGQTVTSPVPQPIQSIDYIKRGVGELIESKMRGGSMGKTEARALRNRLSDMLERVDAVVPEYKAARAQFAGDQELRDALEMGREFSKTDGREVAQTLRSLSPSARALYAQGAIDDLAQTIRGTTDGHDVVRKVFGNDLKREALRSLVGDEAFQQLTADLGTETRMLRSKNFTLGGSNTVDKAQEALDIDKAGIPQAALSLMRGRLGDAASNVAQSALVNRMRGVTTETANALAPKLVAGMNGDRQALDEVLRELMAFQRREMQRQTTRATASRPITGTIGGALGGSFGQRR